jgi:hypothetical protein
MEKKEEFYQSHGPEEISLGMVPEVVTSLYL